jgi:hypothetical protein
MGIGTSDGQYYEDEFEAAVGQSADFSWVDDGNKVNKPPVTLKEVGQSALNDVQKFGQSVADALTLGPKLMQKVAQGEVDLNDEEAIKHVTELTTNFGISGLLTSAYKPGLGIFGGRMSQTAKTVAETMETAGVPERMVKAMTGLERGAEGLWRKEISDRDAVYHKDNWAEKIADGDDVALAAGLSDVYTHSKFYKAYPEARDLPIFEMKNFGNSPENHGLFTVQTIDGAPQPVILVKRGLSNEAAISAITHELQHYVQWIEGFDMPNKYAIAPPLLEKIKADLAKRILGKEESEKVLELNRRREQMSPELLSKANAAAAKLLDDVDYEIYRALTHETEAFNVNARHNMSPAERRLSLGKDTEDVPRRKQIMGQPAEDPYRPDLVTSKMDPG